MEVRVVEMQKSIHSLELENSTGRIFPRVLLLFLFSPSAFPPDCSFFLSPFFLGGGCLGFHARGKTVSPAPSMYSTRTRVWHKKKRDGGQGSIFRDVFFRAVRQKRREGGKGDMWPLSCMDEGFPMLGRKKEKREELPCPIYAEKFVKSMLPPNFRDFDRPNLFLTFFLPQSLFQICERSLRSPPTRGRSSWAARSSSDATRPRGRQNPG